MYNVFIALYKLALYLMDEKIMNFKFRVVNTAIMSVMLSFLMTMFITFINLGWSDSFFTNFFNAWKVALPAAFLAVLIIGQPVQNLTRKILKTQ